MTDQSGNAVNATNAAVGGGAADYKAGILGGTAIYRFDPADIDAYGMTAQNLGTGDFWIVFVAKASASNIVILSSADGSDSVLLGEAGSELLSVRDGTNTVQKALLLARNAFRVYEVVRSSGTITCYENGVSLGTGTLSAAVTFARLGYLGSGGYFWNGDVSEIIVCGAAPTPAQREQVIGRIHDVLGITPLPTFPFTGNPPHQQRGQTTPRFRGSLAVR